MGYVFKAPKKNMYDVRAIENDYLNYLYNKETGDWRTIKSY